MTLKKTKIYYKSTRVIYQKMSVSSMWYVKHKLKIDVISIKRLADPEIISVKWVPVSFTQTWNNRTILCLHLLLFLYIKLQKYVYILLWISNSFSIIFSIFLFLLNFEIWGLVFNKLINLLLTRLNNLCISTYNENTSLFVDKLLWKFSIFLKL